MNFGEFPENPFHGTSCFKMQIGLLGAIFLFINMNIKNLRWYYDKIVQGFKMNFPYDAKHFLNEESRLIIYIWNPERKHFKLTNPRIQIIELK